MTIHRQPEFVYSDSDPSDPAAIYAELSGNVSHTCVIDNAKCPVAKLVLVTMHTVDGRQLTLDAGYYGPFESGKTDISSLSVQVSGFQFAWQNLGSTLWDCTGVSAPQGKYFDVFGVSWNEFNQPHLIFHEGP